MHNAHIAHLAATRQLNHMQKNDGFLVNALSQMHFYSNTLTAQTSVGSRLMVQDASGVRATVHVHSQRNQGASFQVARFWTQEHFTGSAADALSAFLGTALTSSTRTKGLHVAPVGRAFAQEAINVSSTSEAILSQTRVLLTQLFGQGQYLNMLWRYGLENYQGNQALIDAKELLEMPLAMRAHSTARGQSVRFYATPDASQKPVLLFSLRRKGSHVEQDASCDQMSLVLHGRALRALLMAGFFERARAIRVRGGSITPIQ